MSREALVLFENPFDHRIFFLLLLNLDLHWLLSEWYGGVPRLLG